MVVSPLGFGFGSWVWTMTQTQTQKEINLGLDSEFNSIHFGIEIKECLKVLRPKKFVGPKKFEKNLRKFF
jgi:hypothetical protein